MERLETKHHQLIMTLIILIVFTTGIALGVKLSSAAQGTPGMEITIFALSFLTIVMVFLIFTHVMQLKDMLDRQTPKAQPAIKSQSTIQAPKPKRK